MKPLTSDLGGAALNPNNLIPVTKQTIFYPLTRASGFKRPVVACLWAQSVDGQGDEGSAAEMALQARAAEDQVQGVRWQQRLRARAAAAEMCKECWRSGTGGSGFCVHGRQHS